jgi:hypothetical protein
MSPSQPVDDLLAGPEPTRLPDDFPAVREGLETGEDPARLAADFPASSLAWAVLAEDTLAGDTLAADQDEAHGAARAVTAYAYARTGYHRGLDALRRAGWRGRGPIPADHAPNEGFLRALLALATAADAIGETAEGERCRQFLLDSGTSADEVRALAD